MPNPGTDLEGNDRGETLILVAFASHLRFDTIWTPYTYFYAPRVNRRIKRASDELYCSLLPRRAVGGDVKPASCALLMYLEGLRQVLPICYIRCVFMILSR